MVSVIFNRTVLPLVGVVCFALCGAEHIAAGRDPAARMKKGAAAPVGFLSTNSAERRRELHEAISASVGTVLGARRDVASLKASLLPMWEALAKNSHDRVDHRSLRYAVHRYLLRAHGVSIVGLEPTAAKNQTEDAAFIKTQAPLLVKEALEGAAAEEGFSLDDVVAMIVMLEHLVKNAAEPHLQELFRFWQVGMDDHVPEGQFRQVMQSWFWEMMLESMGDDEGIRMIREDETQVRNFFDDWRDLSFYVAGSIESFRSGRSISTPVRARNPFKPTFSFSDALDIAGDMSLSIGRYWDSECSRLKDALLPLDRSSTGRVRLADFHNAALHGEWRFSESKEYLRHFGALDETSSWLGPQVIIANYVQGPSNCIVSTTSFRVCCMNHCEDILGDIEEVVRGPAAAPQHILSTVAQMTALDDSRVAVTSKARKQLYNIAQVHHGVVPLHGRLFAQWLHYLFPTECPYPHKSGTMGSMSFFEFGKDSLASTVEIRTHAADVDRVGSSAMASDINASKTEEDVLSLWSHEEELISTNFQPESMSPGLAYVAFGVLMLGGLAFTVKPSQALDRLTTDRRVPFIGSALDAHAHII